MCVCVSVWVRACALDIYLLNNRNEVSKQQPTAPQPPDKSALFFKRLSCQGEKKEKGDDKEQAQEPAECFEFVEDKLCTPMTCIRISDRPASEAFDGPFSLLIL